jgi:pteridine reductase
VNNASTFETGDLLTLSTSDWDRVMGVNVRGPFLMVREAAALLKEAGGSVVNIVDLSAFHPWVDYPHHSVSKAALLHLTRVMARSLAPTVRVNAIAPGTVLAPDNFTDADAAGDAARTPLGQIGTPEDVVRTVLFLAGSGFVTGEVITVDGGRHLRG